MNEIAQKLREALSQIEDALNDAYQSAGQECCGHGYGECCGNPEPVWDAADQKIMDVLGPIQRMLSDAISQADAQAAEIARLRKLVAEMTEHDTYETEYDGRMYSICHGCGAQDGEPHRDPNCVYVRARAALQEKFNG